MTNLPLSNPNSTFEDINSLIGEIDRKIDFEFMRRKLIELNNTLNKCHSKSE